MPTRDPVELEIFKNIFHSIAEEMGASLRRTAFSPNIKERRDYSCALFNPQGQVIAMGDHMPVHLGSMPMSVRAAIDRLNFEIGDIAMLNDPFAGGTHLPDITMVMPVWWENPSPRTQRRREKNSKMRPAATSRPDFYVASRAHHADIGGTYAGSMGLCREIYQEGLRIPPVKLVRRGEMDQDVLAMVLANVRTPGEREGDLGAQIAACNTGAARLREICARYGLPRVKLAATELLDYSEEMMRALLCGIEPGEYAAEDFLDDDGIGERPVRIAVKITVKSERSKVSSVVVDFTGSDPQVQGSVNAVEAITYSAVFYVFRCLVADDVPATSGLMRPVRVIAPAGTVVNAVPPAAVAGGNVEMSQRIVDVLLKALAPALPGRIPAAASGTMNNLTIGGIDPGTGMPFAYYETIAGGMGAHATNDGVSGVHTHMTNSLNTPAEALEYAYPVRVTQYGLRRGSGGEGRHRGGDGVVREIEVLTDAEVTMLSDRRKRGPYGLEGGSAGVAGKNEIVRLDGSVEPMPSKGSARLKKGERIRVETPGGGGFGGQREEVRGQE
jgi:N-methylhydantoinase B